MTVAVFDVGGSHISYDYFDLQQWRLKGAGDRLAHSTHSSEYDPLHLLTGLVQQAREVSGRALQGLSLAMPGPFDYAAGVSHMRHKLRTFYGVDLKQALSDVGHIAPEAVMFINDADAFLLGALHFANFAAVRSVGITLGTGVGSAFSSANEILCCGDGVPSGGEIWNLAYGNGTVEDAISTRNLESAYRERTGRSLSVKSIAQAATTGDSTALQIFEEFGETLGDVLEEVCGSFDPQQILLGGGICGAADLFLPSVLKRPWCIGRVTIVQNRDAAPLAGAAIAWQGIPMLTSGDPGIRVMDSAIP
jgi:glucokinase